MKIFIQYGPLIKLISNMTSYMQSGKYEDLRETPLSYVSESPGVILENQLGAHELRNLRFFFDSSC